MIFVGLTSVVVLTILLLIVLTFSVLRILPFRCFLQLLLLFLFLLVFSELPLDVLDVLFFVAIAP